MADFKNQDLETIVIFVLVNEFSHNVNHFIWLTLHHSLMQVSFCVTADVCRQVGFVCVGLERHLSSDCLEQLGVRIVALGVLHGFNVVQNRFPSLVAVSKQVLDSCKHCQNLFGITVKRLGFRDVLCVNGLQD